jgi:hypothetical protein
MKSQLTITIEHDDDGEHCGECAFNYGLYCEAFGNVLNYTKIKRGKFTSATKTIRCQRCIAQAKKVEE